MHVAVTGSSGKIGREAVRFLAEAGHTTVGFDLKPDPGGGRCLPVDCTDFGQVLGALSGVDIATRIPDAVIHLAGIPAPGLAPDHVTFDVNMSSTYNVFSACARLGIPRVVWGSSETIFGLPYRVPPPFLPIDETTPDRPEFHYSLTKQLGEATADAMVRWNDNLTIYSLRFSNVYSRDDRAGLPLVQANPAGRKGNLWAYVDAADAGRACALAVSASTVSGDGAPVASRHERIVIGAADTIVDVASAQLHATYFPDVDLRQPLEGYSALLRSTRAAELIGYEPQVSWRDW